MYLILLSLFSYLCYVGKNFLDAYRRCWSLAHLPQPARDNIIQGHALSLNKGRKKNKLLDVFVGWTAECGPTFFFFIGNKTINCFTTDTTILKAMTTDLVRFAKVPDLPNRQIDGQIITGTSSILSAEGLNWATKRKTLSKFFAKTNIANLFDISKENLNGPVHNFWRKASDSGDRSVDLHDLLAITFASCIKTFGLKEIPSSETIAMYANEILEGIKIRASSTFDLFKLLTVKNRPDIQILVRKARKELNAVVMDKMETFNYERDEPANDSLLEFLIHANYHMLLAENKKVTHTNVAHFAVSDIMTVILVMDNLTKQLCTLFMFLDTNKAAQERMFTELREVELEGVGDLGKLVYTEQCLLEALRMGPALTRGTRIYTVPKAGEENAGTFFGLKMPESSVKLNFSEYVQHTNPKYWPNPHTFDPDRWAADKSPPAQFSYIPFLAGPRACIAKHVTMLLLKLTLSMIGKNFDVKQDFGLGEDKPRIDQNIAPLKILGKVTAFVRPVSAN